MNAGRQRVRKRLRRGAYMLPSLLTIGNILMGFYALICGMRGDFQRAALLIFAAALLDALDGRLARLTGTDSDFGREFDSLADVLTFGATPAVLTYLWGLDDLGRIGWLVPLCYLVCTATRLARFNVQTNPVDSRFFVGLPAPAAACALGSILFFAPTGPYWRWGASVLIAGAALPGRADALDLSLLERQADRSAPALELPHDLPGRRGDPGRGLPPAGVLSRRGGALHLRGAGPVAAQSLVSTARSAAAGQLRRRGRQLTILAVIEPNTLSGTELRQELRQRRDLWSEVRLLSAEVDPEIAILSELDGAALVQPLSAEPLDGRRPDVRLRRLRRGGPTVGRWPAPARPSSWSRRALARRAASRWSPG